MAQLKPKLLQFVVGKVRQNIKVNIILSKRLCVLSEAELFEPSGQIVHSDTSHQWRNLS
jgi:hypothetical protein